MSETKTLRPQLALEMTMRDVLGNMEEMVGEYAYRDLGGEFEVLAIEPARVPDAVTDYRQDPRIRELFSAEFYQLPISA